MGLFDADYVPSTWPPSAEQVALYEQSGGRDGNDFQGAPCVILTTIGARSHSLRKTPVIRVEENGRYAVIGSMGGAPMHPGWVHNLRTEPRCRVQDGEAVHELRARELTGEQRTLWWKRATMVLPDYDTYQSGTTRVIPLFLLEADTQGAEGDVQSA